MQHISRLRLLKPTSTNTALRYASNVTPGPSGSSSSSNPARPPYLPRPLGVRQAPSKIKLTKQEEKARFLDPERRSEERKAITKELQKSYFQDLSSLSQNGGKLWIAPETVIRAEKALYFPPIEGFSLANKESKNTVDVLGGKVSLVAVLSTQISVEHVNSFISAVAEDQRDEPSFQVVQINLQENPVKSWLVSLFLSSLRKQVPDELHENYILTHQNIDQLKEPMGMMNKHIGYLYLVDWHSRIRWAGVGFAEQGGKELAGLRACVSVLLKRLKEGTET